MKKTSFILLLLINSVLSSGQSKLGNEWITGGGGQRVKFIDTNIFTNNDHFILSYFDSGNSNICDTNGNLILCSDGYNVYDSNSNYIDGGDTLIPIDYYTAHSGSSILSQSSIFLPIDSDKYYFVTPTMSNTRYADCLANNHCFFDLLLYNIIDMKSNGGAGKVVKRMQPIMQNANLSKTQMMACRHGNGKDWWLLKQGGDSNIIYKFLFTNDSIYDKGRQVFNAPMWGGWDIKGQTAISKDGSKYGSTVQGNSTGEVFIADFDRCYGILSNPKVIIMPKGSQHDPSDTTMKERLPTGLAYSPNGNLLYVISMSNIYQYDLQDTTWYHVAGLDTSYAKFQLYNASYLGLDDKLYIGNFGGTSKQMSRIDNPDVKGIGCNFCPRCLRLDTLGTPAWVGTPPCMPNYSLGAKVCYLLDTPDISRDDYMLIYPNPSSGMIYIKNRLNKKKRLYNLVGVLLQTTFKDEIDIKNYAEGIYFIKCEGQTKMVIVE